MEVQPLTHLTVLHFNHTSKSSDIIELDFPKHCTTKRLQPHVFGNLENCINPSKKDFKRNSTYEKNFFIVTTNINVKC